MGTAKKQQIPGYKLLKPLGSGGQASVYKAVQLSMKRPVAVKVIFPERGVPEIELGRFLREARVLAKLRHESIVQAIDYGEHGGVRYLVMEFVEGVTVLELLETEGALGRRRALEIALQVCAALEHAAGLGVIHRDVKPANIVITKANRAVLVDFGLARPETGDFQLTMTGTTVGTPHYMSPEQIRGDENLDHRGDIYALGSTLFHMLTGRVPFPAKSKLEIMACHLKEPIELPESLPEQIPDYIFDVVKKAMEKDPDDRYASAKRMLADLRRAKEMLEAEESGVLEADLLGRGREWALQRRLDEVVQERDRLAEYTKSLEARLAALEERAGPMVMSVPEVEGTKSEPELVVEPVPGSALASPMVYVQGGSFLYGDDHGDDVDRPRRKVRVDSFWIDVYPVTNREYAEFVRATGHRFPQHWESPEPSSTIATHPVVHVTWKDACAYAEWCGKRLPTMVEWQAAARGRDGRQYPWGDEPDPSRLNCRESRIGETTPVGKYPGGISPCGLHEAAGNVAEWVSGSFPGANKGQPLIRAVCSGSFRDPIRRSRCASRRGYRDEGKAAHVGFRCARDAKPEDEP
jgi:serine/threonine-protein kinase